jgi:hypothetical protein
MYVLIFGALKTTMSTENSSVAQWQSMRLLTAGLLVRVQPGEHSRANPKGSLFLFIGCSFALKSASVADSISVLLFSYRF